jgi:hypothetical protein
MPSRLTKSALILKTLEAAASEGRRCPTNAELADILNANGAPVATSSVPGIVSQLVRAGHIIVSVYPLNWRVVTITSGYFKRHKTAAPPTQKKPYLVIDQAERAKRDAALRLKRSACFVGKKPWPQKLYFS